MEKVKRTWYEISAVVGNKTKARMKWLLTIVGDRPKILKSAVSFSKMQQEMSAFMALALGQDEDKAFHISRPLAKKWYDRIFHGIGRFEERTRMVVACSGLVPAESARETRCGSRHHNRNLIPRHNVAGTLPHFLCCRTRSFALPLGTLWTPFCPQQGAAILHQAMCFTRTTEKIQGRKAHARLKDLSHLFTYAEKPDSARDSAVEL